MCRLLYVNSKYLFSSTDYLNDFARISKNSKEFQGHGWGCAYIRDGKWIYYKNVKPIWEDDLSKFDNTSRLIAHARSAYKDEGIVVENNMPFHDDRYIFIFNGELRGVKIKEDGRIGAEKIFNYLKRFDKGNIKEAIRKGTDIIKDRTQYIKAMNIILTSNKSVFIYSRFNEEEEYFTMRFKKNSNQIIVCSEKLTEEEDWIPIENNFLMEFECF